MENASKALIMAGGMLIAVMVASIAVYLFSAFGGTSKQIQQDIDSRVLAEFNNTFIKFQGSSDCTIHDIVSLASFAKKNNKDNFEFTIANINDPYYVEVYIKGDKRGELSNVDDYTELIQNNTTTIKNGETTIKYYSCTIEYNGVAEYERVKKITFKEI